MEDKSLPIVIDNGSHTMKAGFAGYDSPSLVFPTIIGHPPKLLRFFCGRKSFIGNQAMIKRDNLFLEYPIDNGAINNWDDMEMVWNHIFEELNANPQERPILLTEIPFNIQVNRKKIAEIMFEKYNVPALYLTHQAVASLFASGRTTGISLHSGDGITHVVPVHNGIVLQNSVSSFDIAGNGLSQYLIDIFKKNNIHFKKVFERDSVYGIKEKHCYVAYDFSEEILAPSMPGKSYILPDGQSITLGNERFSCCEALFRPSLVSTQASGIHQILQSSIQKCNVDIHNQLYANIVLSGGTTLLPGFTERLQKEIALLAPSIDKINVFASPERKYSAWIGGSILATSFSTTWLTKQQYKEEGLRVVNRM